MRLSSAAFLVCLLGAWPGATAADELLWKVFQVLEKELDFFADDYSSINLDGLFGLRIGQGQLRAAIRECKQQNPCGEEVLARLERLEGRLNEACESAIPYVKTMDDDYFQRFEDTVSKPYMLSYTPTLFDDHEKVEPGTNAAYDEETGDRCYSRVLGTFIENNRQLPKCNVTSDCWDYMSRDNTKGYAITHQLLYFEVIEQVGCTEAVERSLENKNIFDVQKKFCRMIFEESKQLEKAGKVRYNKKDLFLEQTLLCGAIGFESFLRSDWIEMVTEWPDKRIGCFRQSFKDSILSLVEDIEEEKSETQTAAEKDTYTGNSGSTMRKLLRESKMKDGCLSHTSGLGFGAFCTYVRYLLRQG